MMQKSLSLFSGRNDRYHLALNRKDPCMKDIRDEAFDQKSWDSQKENCLTSGVELLPPVLHRREGSSASISVDSLGLVP